MNNLFKNELEELSIIINSKTIIQNILYKLSHDRNVIYFLDNVVENAKKYDGLERMEKYYFNKELTEMYELLNNLIYVLLQESPTKNKTSVEILEPCSVLPDNGGLSLIRKLGYFPLIQLLEEKRTTEKYIDSYNSESNVEFFKKEQDKKLFGKGFRLKKNPKDKDFMDYDLKNKYIKDKKEKYEDSKVGLDENIMVIVSLFEKSKDKKEIEKQVGSQFWDAKSSNKRDGEQKLAELFKLMINGMDEGNK